MDIISIGEVLWDVIDGEEHLGGAPFNFAAHAARLGHQVRFISAVGNDERGKRTLAAISRLGLFTGMVRRVDGQPTGTVAVSLDRARQPRFNIPRPAAYDFPELTGEQLEDIRLRPPDWVYFGTLQQTSRQARETAIRVLEAAPSAGRFYDVNLRAGCYTEALVRELLSSASVVKLNLEEAMVVGEMLERRPDSLEGFCRMNARRFGWQAVAITRGADGSVLLVGDRYVEAGGYRVVIADAVGAGDAFAAAFIHALNAGWPPGRIADFCNRVGALVASREGAVPAWDVGECEDTVVSCGTGEAGRRG